MLPILKLYLETRMKGRRALKFCYMKMADKLEADRRQLSAHILITHAFGRFIIIGGGALTLNPTKYTY